MFLTEKEFQAQLKEAGTRLLEPPDSVQELLPLLDQVWASLTNVEQAPSKPLQDALAPSTNALVGHKLIRHSDVDVKATVASCICEITRITAPDAPYDDDRMKEAFRLIVSSFELLFDQSSPSYMKRTSTLETVAKVKSCAVMLDLELDDLIIEMFQHFVKSIRDYHPPEIFSAMETIMILVIHESEDVTPNLLSPILASVKNDNKDVLPIARKLGERVLKSTATRVRQYLLHAVKILGLSVDDYSEIVASICRGLGDNACHNDVSVAEPVADKSNAERASSEETKDTSQGVVQETAKEPTPPQKANAQTVEESSLADVDIPDKQEKLHPSDQAKAEAISSTDEPAELDVNNAGIAEKNEHTGTAGGTPPASDKKAGVDLSSPKKGVDESESISLLPSTENQTVENSSNSELENQKEHLVNEVDRITDMVASKILDETKDPKASQTKQSMKQAPSASSEDIETSIEKQIGENGSESGIEEKNDVMKDVSKAADVASRKISDETSVPEANQRYQPERSVKKSRTISSEEDAVQSSEKEIITNESETKKQKSKRADRGNKSGATSSTKQPDERKRRSLVNATSKKPASKSPAKGEDKKVSSKLGKSTPKTNLKRKRSTGNEKESETKELGEELVGSKIKVWWPKDKTFYKGVVDSFDAVKKRHKIAYDDGDVERLNLEREKYVLLEDGSDSDKEEEIDSSLNMLSEEPSKKKRKLVLGLAASKSSGGTSRKNKSASSRASGKSRSGSKVDGKSKGSNSGKKSKEDVVGKSKDSGSKSANKLKDTDASKSSNLKIGLSTPNGSAKSKEDTPRTDGKTEEETPRTASLSRGVSTRSGGKSDASGRMKSSLSE